MNTIILYYCPVLRFAAESTMVVEMTRGETLLFLNILFFHHSSSQKVDLLNSRRGLFTPPPPLLRLSGVNGPERR